MPLTPLYPVRVVGTPNVDHPLLSAAAKALSNDALAWQSVAAETGLGLFGTNYTGDRADRATVAVVRQVNKQVAAPDNPYLTEDRRGERSESFAVFRDLGGASALDPISVEIVRALAAEAAADVVETTRTFAPFQSVR